MSDSDDDRVHSGPRVVSIDRSRVDRFEPPAPTVLPATPTGQGLDVTVTWLQMQKRPLLPAPRHRAEQTAIMRAHPPTLAFYKFLYRIVGQDWCWWERRSWDDERLQQTIQHPDVHVYVLHVNGTPAGFAELDNRQGGDLEVTYFGIAAPFTGRGLGRYFLQWTVQTAWTFEPERVWLHTCTLDHPAALPLYQKLGFVPYQQERQRVEDPRPLMQRPWL